MAIEILHLSSVVRGALVDRDGDRLGRVEDLIAQLGFAPHPPVTGVVVRIARRQLFVPIARIPDLQPGRVQFVGDTVSLKRFERRPGEVLLVQGPPGPTPDQLPRCPAHPGQRDRAGPGRRSLGGRGRRPQPTRGVAPPAAARPSVGASRPGKVVDWASIEPFVAHVPTARLRIPYRKLARLHPAQIADLVEAASHEEGEEIIEAVGQDRELEADVFEELDAEHQIEFVRSRTDAEAARLLATMAPDDAADLIVELDQDRRLPCSSSCPGPSSARSAPC